MKSERMWWIMISALAGALGLSTFWLPAPLTADAPLFSFSAARAFELIKTIAHSPHPTGSPENLRVREHLLGKMRELGLKPREIEGERDGIKVVNLYGELEGTISSKVPVLLVSHYDSTPYGPGAADDATGVATCLETIRALKARGPFRNTIGVLITDGEELPNVMLGSSTFVHDQTNLVKDLRVVVNLEARGNHGPVLMFESGQDNGGRIRLFSQACPLPVAASFSEEIYRRMPNDTDFSNFLKVGKRGYNFAFVGGIEFYHTSRDTPGNLSLRTLQHYGDCVLPLAAQLGEADDHALDQCLKPGDATFFPLFRGLLVHYSSGFGNVLAWLTAGLFALALSKGFWGTVLRVRFVVASLGTSLLAVALATVSAMGAVHGLMGLFKTRHYGPFVVGLPFDGGLLACLLVIAAALTFVLRSWLLRRASPSEALVGSLLIWIALMLAANAKLPGASYLFAWPAFFGTIALLVPHDPIEHTRARSLLRTMLTGAPAPLLFAPTILLFHQAITIGIAPVSAAITTLVFCLMPAGRLAGPVKEDSLPPSKDKLTERGSTTEISKT